MEFIKAGKTKDIYKKGNGNIVLKFKDTVTGTAGVSDPGGNEVVGEKKGVASAALKTTTYYFNILAKKKVPSHFVSSNIEELQMEVFPASVFGEGLEFILRFYAAGSFYNRYSSFCKSKQKLSPPVFEVTLKDDKKNDPPITRDALSALNILNEKEFDACEKLTKEICTIVKDDLLEKGITLLDIKIEIGKVNGKIAIIDEISAGNMRAEKDGELLDYIKLSELILS